MTVEISSLRQLEGLSQHPLVYLSELNFKYHDEPKPYHALLNLIPGHMLVHVVTNVVCHLNACHTYGNASLR